MKKRCVMTVIGLLLLSVGMGMLKAAGLGTDPYSGFATQLSVFLHNKLQLSWASYGNVFTGMTALLFIWVFAADRHFIHFGTVLHVLFVGKLTAVIQHFLESIIIPDTNGKRMIMLLGAFVIFCFASAIYYAANLGVSAYDAVSLYMAKRQIMEYRYARILTDVVCIVMGCICSIAAGGLQGVWGSSLGIGTLLTAFGMGPFVQYLRERIFDPMANGTPEGKKHINVSVQAAAH